MKQYLKVGAFVLSLALAAYLIYLVNIFTGYPVSCFVVKNALDTYMEETYGDTDFVAGKPEHVFKQGGFLVEVHSPSSPDTSFGLKFYGDGTLVYDTYEGDVLSGVNTAMRFSDAYQQLTKTVFESSPFPFAATCSGSFEDAIAQYESPSDEPGTCPLPWDISKLTLDQDGEIPRLAARYGKLYLQVTAEEVSVQTASEALLAIREVMEKANLPFRSVELWVFSQEQDEPHSPGEELHLLNYGWDEISEEGMEERVQEAVDATAAYFDRE